MSKEYVHHLKSGKHSIKGTKNAFEHVMSLKTTEACIGRLLKPTASLKNPCKKLSACIGDN